MKTFCEHLLLENRVEVLKKKYAADVAKWFPHDDHDSVHQEIVQVDPTHNKIYLDWLYRQALSGVDLFFEDVDGITVDLEIFEANKRHMPVARRDINFYKSYRDLRREMLHYDVVQSNKQIKREEVEQWKKDIITVYDGPDGQVYIPKTEAASCFLGRGTKWCTASKNNNAFEDYTHMGTPLFVFVRPDGSKWQYHAWNSIIGIDVMEDIVEWVEQVQLMNEQDIDIMGTRLQELLHSPAGNAAIAKYPEYFLAGALRVMDANKTREIARKTGELDTLVNQARLMRSESVSSGTPRSMFVRWVITNFS